ncbi:MAG: ATP-binding cassette domain-containing protein [Chromatiaceae bacterium]|jgi:ABC-2 type transport system ATP-binding protein|nr:ATP-binding cassette domain-containing protein [Chromatiaceae bacterium]
MAILEVSDLCKQYGKVKALDGVSVSLDEGELVALLGPNGAGKSTLFQLLTGLFVPDSGFLRVAGHDLRREPVAALRHIGVVFQQPTLDLDLSLRGNLQFFCRLQGVDGATARERIDAALARVGLADRRHDRVRDLSGGNRRKVELIRALLHRPRVLLMDEPTVGLDPASRHTLLTEVLSLCKEQGVGVLWATHLVEEAEQAHRVLVLHQGRKLAEGTPEALVAASVADTLAAAFLQMTKRTPVPEERTP